MTIYSSDLFTLNLRTTKKTSHKIKEDTLRIDTSVKEKMQFTNLPLQKDMQQ